MKNTMKFIFGTLLVVTVLQCPQGMSIHSPQVVTQPITADNCSDTAVVETLIKAYTEKDNATLHRFLNKLLPVVNTQYDFETTDDFLAHLEGNNSSSLTNHTINSRPAEGIEPARGDDTIETRGTHSSEDKKGTLKSSKKKSHRRFSSSEDLTVSNNRLNKTEHIEVSVNDSFKNSMPLPSPMGGVSLGEEVGDVASKHPRSSLKHKKHSDKEMYQTTQAPISLENVANSSSNALLSTSLQPKEPSKICSPKAIIDILRKGLSPQITNVYRGDLTQYGSRDNKSESLTLGKTSNKENDDSLKDSRPLAVMKIFDRNLDTDIINDLAQSHSPSKENVKVRSLKKTKDKSKHSKSPVVNSDSDNFNDNSISSSSKEPSTFRNSKKVKNSRNKESMENNISSTEISTARPSGDIAPSVLPLEVESTSDFPETPVESFGHRKYKNTFNENVADNLTPSFPRSPSTNAPTVNVRRKFKDHTARNQSSTNLKEDALTNSMLPLYTRELQDDFLPKQVETTLHNKDVVLKEDETIHPSHFEDGSREPINDFEKVNREDRGTIPKYTQNSSITHFDETGGILKQSIDLDFESMRGQNSFVHLTDNEDTLRDTRAEEFKKDYPTLSHGTTNVGDSPYRITLSQNEKESSSPNHNSSPLKHSHSPGFFSGEYSQENWHGIDEEIMCDDSDELFDDWASSCVDERDYFEDIKTRSTSIQSSPLESTDPTLNLGNSSDKGNVLNVSRRETPSNHVYPHYSPPSWQSSCQPYLPLSYYWQYYLNSWPPRNYVPQVNYNVPPFYCEPCPRSCSDPPPKPRPPMCQPCPPLFCSHQYRPQYSSPFYKPSTPRPKCPPCPKYCFEPCLPRPPGCKKCPPLKCPPSCPPCPKWCVSPGHPPRHKNCAPCPKVPTCCICSHCGNNIGISTLSYYCPFCNSPTFNPYSTQPNYPSQCNTRLRKETDEDSDETSKPNNSDSTRYIPLITNNVCGNQLSCPACPDRCVYPNYPKAPKYCKSCPSKPDCKATPRPRCEPCPTKCVPKDYPRRQYGCDACPCLPVCS